MPSASVDEGTRRRQEASSKIANPLAGLSREQLSNLGEKYCQENGFTSEEDIRAFRLGAMCAGDSSWDTIEGLTESERSYMDKEVTNKWSNPKALYGVIVGK